MAQDHRKNELIAELARARALTTANFRELREDTNVVRRLRTAFQRHQITWLAGAGLCGFLLSKIPARTRKVAPKVKLKPSGQETAVKAGLLVTTLKLAFDIARPFLTKWLTRRVVTYAQNRFADGGRI